jgi:hypothetical protein
LLWATPPQPDEDLCQHLQIVYERYQLDQKNRYQWRSKSYYQTNFDRFAQIVEESGWFERSEITIKEHQSRYSVEK